MPDYFLINLIPFAVGVEQLFILLFYYNDLLLLFLVIFFYLKIYNFI